MAFCTHSPPGAGASARCHAAPLELGGPDGICGYKHGAPNGAAPVSVAEDTYILRRRPEPTSDLAGSHGSLVPIAI